MKRFWLTLVAAAVLTVSAVAPAAAQDTVTIDMKEVDGSGQVGSADITTDGDQVIVSIEIDAGEEGVPQPAHIHEGTCQDLGDVAYPLDDVEDGVSESTADVSMSELLAEEYAINVHLSEDEADTYVSCGNLPLIGGGSDDGEGDDAAEEEDEAAEEDDEAAEEDDADEGSQDEAEEATDDQDGGDEAAQDEDQAAEEDDADEAAEDNGDAAADDEDADATEDDDATAEDDEEAEEVAPATGSLSGPEAGAGIGAMLLLAGGALSAGLFVRRRAHQA